MSWLLAFAGFAVLIILHEAGHMVAAKAVGMRVERFFLFFPPKLVSWKRGETEYGIGAIPLGGFVKITGMNPDEVHPPDHPRQAGRATRFTAVMEGDAAGGEDDFKPLPPEVAERAYYNQPVWKRIVVIGAGPAVNIVLAFLILFALTLTAKEPAGSGLEISEVQADAPAKGVLQADDKIISIDGVAATDLSAEDRATKLRDQIGTHTCAGTPTDGCKATTPVEIVVERDGQRVPLAVTPEYDADADRVLLGFRFAPTAFASAHNSVPTAAKDALDDMWFVASRTVSVIARIFDSEQRKQISGPVGTGDALHEAIGFDARLAITFLGIISLSLGLINLFPFLPLDGGHIFWSLVEKLRGRPVTFLTMERASAVGFALVLMLFFIGLSNDIPRVTGGEGFNAR
ncbi:MAG: M50 family metallopeptidase [Solirubrobacterales bacterium]